MIRLLEKNSTWVIVLGIFFISGALILPFFSKTSFSPHIEADLDAVLVAESREGREVTHLDTPEPLKAIYMTACVAGTSSWRESLKKLIESTEINAVVIDIKDATGRVAFPNDFAPSTSSGCVVSDLGEFIMSLHESGIYVIGRISVFQDPAYTALHPELAVKSLSTGGVWRDRKGLSFIDVGAKEYWDYIIKISNASYALGFDELNFDYIRYPSDGNMQDVSYDWMTASSSKPEMLENFFRYLYENLRGSGAKLSADLFGMTTTVESDMGIGQVLERALPYFDYIYPMVYPSHYPKGWNGYANPAAEPYNVIKIAMTSGVEREQAWLLANNLATSTPSKLRPWLQDFDLGANYDAAEVRAQIQATYDSGITSWLLWSAGNVYTTGALLPQ